MSNNKFHETLGVTRQMLHSVVAGKRNFNIHTARKASALFGGTTETWIDPDMADLRKFFYERTKGEGKNDVGMF